MSSVIITAVSVTSGALAIVMAAFKAGESWGTHKAAEQELREDVDELLKEEHEDDE